MEVLEHSIAHSRRPLSRRAQLEGATAYTEPPFGGAGLPFISPMGSSLASSPSPPPPYSESQSPGGAVVNTNSPHIITEMGRPAAAATHATFFLLKLVLKLVLKASTTKRHLFCRRPSGLSPVAFCTNYALTILDFYAETDAMWFVSQRSMCRKLHTPSGLCPALGLAVGTFKFTATSEYAGVTSALEVMKKLDGGLFVRVPALMFGRFG
ncbi:hypothetical protein EDB83DRAFT_2681079 [Lactarius deliciosus]|nr:hypothetical protein EDB83DRAFT_2681079 [Lactarius deliciosus]